MSFFQFRKEKKRIKMGNGKQTQRSVDQFDAWFFEGALWFSLS